MILERVVAGVRGFTVVAGAAGVWLWILLAYPFTFRAWWSGLAFAVLLAAFLAPVAVLVALLRAVHVVRTLPARTAELNQKRRAGTARLGTSASAGPPRRRLWGVGKALYELWSLVYESRDMLLEYTALARLATPATLLVVLGAGLLSLLIMAAAALGTVLVMVF